MMKRLFNKSCIRIPILMIIIACIMQVCLPYDHAKSENLTPITGYDATRPELLMPDQLYAASALLMDANTGMALYEKDPDKKLSPASTTKVMTLLLAIEYAERNNFYQEYITVPREAENVPAGSSITPVKSGEMMLFIDLLYGCMLPSGNDAANAIAVIVGGSLDAFVDMMNQRAAELGCVNTHFSNAHGYTAEMHYSTARDIAIMSREGMKHETFRNIVGTGKYIMEATNKRGGITIENTNSFATGRTGWRYEFGTGIKTGYTSDAGYCLAASATDTRGVSLIAVVLNATATNTDARWIDSKRLMEYGFSQCNQYAFIDLYNMQPFTIRLENAVAGDPGRGSVTLEAVLNRATNFHTLLFNQQLAEAADYFHNSLVVEYTHSLQAPVEKGTIIGNATFNLPNGESVSALLTAGRDVAAEPAPFSWEGISNLFDVVPVWMVLATILLFIIVVSMGIGQFVNNQRRRRERRRQAERRREMERKRKLKQHHAPVRQYPGKTTKK